MAVSISSILLRFGIEIFSNFLDLFFFFWPGVSLSIQQFGEHIQLGVITDALIHPLHFRISEGWTRNLKNLL